MDSSIPNREFWVRKLQVKHPNVSISSFSQDLTDAAKDTLIEILELDSDTLSDDLNKQIDKEVWNLVSKMPYMMQKKKSTNRMFGWKRVFFDYQIVLDHQTSLHSEQSQDGGIHQEYKTSIIDKENQFDLENNEGSNEQIDDPLKSQQLYQCQKCPDMYTSNSALVQHEKSVHEGLKHQWEQLFSLFGHTLEYKKIPNIISGNSCKICSEYFYEDNYLENTEDPVEREDKEKYKSILQPVTCKMCRAVFCQVNNFKNHIISEHECKVKNEQSEQKIDGKNIAFINCQSMIRTDGSIHESDKIDPMDESIENIEENRVKIVNIDPTKILNIDPIDDFLNQDIEDNQIIMDSDSSNSDSESNTDPILPPRKRQRKQQFDNERNYDLISPKKDVSVSMAEDWTIGHMDNRSFQCKKCPYTSLDIKDFLKHQESHSNPKKCPICPFIDPSIRTLTEHIYSQHENRRYYCYLCKKSYYYATSAALSVAMKR